MTQPLNSETENLLDKLYESVMFLLQLVNDKAPTSPHGTEASRLLQELDMCKGRLDYDRQWGGIED